ncbi:MAG: OmpA family protein [Mesorhizobium sp.]
MKRQPLILAGTALGLLMASAPLGAFPLQGSADYGMAKGTSTPPLILAQADCQPDAGEDCTPKQKKHREKAAPVEQEQNAAPTGEAAPAEEQKPRRKKQREAEPAPEQQMAPEAQPEQNAAPAEEQKPHRKKKKEASEPAPEQQAAPEAQPEQNAAPADQQEQKPRRKKQKEATEPAPAEQASPGAEPEQPSAGKAESGAKQEKLRNYLKKKQGKEAPAEGQAVPSGEEAPKPGQKPAEQAAPKPEQKPAEATQPPAQNEQPADQAGEPRSKKEKLRDYLKKKEGGEAAPAETEQAGKAQKPAEEGQPAGQAGEAPAGGAQAEGEAGQAAQPQLPADTREQAMPKPRARKGKRPENEAPLPDSAKGGQPAGESNQAGQPQAEEQPKARSKAEALPQSDSAAQTDIGKIGRIESVEAMKGKRLDRKQWLQDQRKWREGNNDRNGGQVVNEIDNRYIVKYGDNIYVDNRGSNVRLERNARDSYVEALPDNFTRYTIVKDDGIRIVTVRNSYGDIVRRSRILPDNREVILYYVPESDYGHIRRGYYDAGADLPPLRLDIPADEYILDAQYAEPDDYYTYLDAPPVEPVERIYSVDEVVHSARIRDKVRRIDLDTITFDTGSAEIGEDQVNHLEALGDAINRILKQNPAETFLIEGHTDAVGSDESNLVLSDERAQSVAEALTSVFDIPAENLTTQGYGERYLKVNTQGASRDNRRVAVRRITPLVAPVASAK